MSSVVTSRIQVSLTPPIARIILDRPQLNVIDLAMAQELHHALGEMESRSDISTILFEGNTRAFSAGVDVAAHLPDQIHEMLAAFHTVIRRVITSRKVTIAAIRGLCLGGGAELAAVCDMVYTADDATWGFPEIKLGCYPPVAATALASIIGQKRATELILTGKQFSGAEAAAMGLATSAVAAIDLAAAVEKTITELSSLSLAALFHAKKAIYAWDAIHFDKGLARAERIYLDELISTADAHEGIIAFLEKRPPKWTGK